MSEKVFGALKTEPPADRWTMWARSISDQHERTVARQRGLIMTLVQPLQMFTSINQRLEKFALAVFPRIRICIGPIIQELARTRATSVQQSLTFPRLRAGLESYTAATGDRKQLESRFFLPASMTVANASIHAEQTQAGSGSDASRGDLKVFSQSPLHRLFDRIHRQSAGVIVKKTLLENESEAIAERVVQKHLRLEQRGREDMVIRKQIIPDAAAEDRRSDLESQLARASTRERSWPEKSPEINVEQLTDQVIRKIDHRITAYRERLGRAF